MPGMGKFADELKEWRDREGITQVTAAEYLDVPYHTYCAWEWAKQEPDQKGPIRNLIALPYKPRKKKS